jgi:carboxymethylenebutenolidase
VTVNRSVVDSVWDEISTPHGAMRLYCARPADEIPRRALLVLQEAFGVNDHIQDVARRAAARGYVTVAPDLFHRSSTPLVDYADRETAMSRIAELGREEIDHDVAAACGHLETTYGIQLEATGLLGFCFGGRAAFTAATGMPWLGATVAFYGPGVASGPHAVLDRIPTLTGPVLMLVGDEDPTIPPSDLDAIRAVAESHGKSVRIEILPDAGHAFHCDARPHLYRPAAAERAWGIAMDFFAAELDAPVSH